MGAGPTIAFHKDLSMCAKGEGVELTSTVFRLDLPENTMSPPRMGELGGEACQRKAFNAEENTMTGSNSWTLVTMMHS